MNDSFAASKMKTSENDVVYVGIPLPEESTASAFPPSFSSESNQTITTEPRRSNFKIPSGYGLLAFLLGIFLASCAWIANQGWAITSLFLFGQFTWTIESAWKHVLFCIFGSVCTAIAYWAVFTIVFPELDEDQYDDDDDVSEKLSLFKKDVSDALQDLGELGFVVGYLGSQILFSSRVYKTLLLDEYQDLNYGLGYWVTLMLWVFLTKMRDYYRAVKRVERVGNVEDSFAYTQIV